MMRRMGQGRMGRPPVPGAPRTTVKLSPEDRALLEATARAETRTMSETVADALRLYAAVHHRDLALETKPEVQAAA